MTSIEATAARDELVDLTLAPIPVAERPSRWAVQVAQQAIAYAATQDAVELAYLLDLVRAEEPMTVLEVGTSYGGSFWAWAQAAHPEAKLVSLDFGPLHPTGHPYASAGQLKAMLQPGQTGEQFWADSQLDETRDLVAEHAPYDFLFIDADHRIEQVTRDHDLYAPLVRDGGIIAFHDIAMVPPHPDPAMRTEVSQLWNRIRPGDAWEWSYAGDRFGIGAYRVTT